MRIPTKIEQQMRQAEQQAKMQAVADQMAKENGMKSGKAIPCFHSVSVEDYPWLQSPWKPLAKTEYLGYDLVLVTRPVAKDELKDEAPGDDADTVFALCESKHGFKLYPPQDSFAYLTVGPNGIDQTMTMTILADMVSTISCSVQDRKFITFLEDFYADMANADNEEGTAE